MAADEDKILSGLGRKKVRFLYPGSEGKLQGILTDRCVLAAGQNVGGVPYWDVIDLITFEEQEEPDFIRIGYYRKPPSLGHLVWGSQTKITEPLSTWRKLFVKAAREKEWFRNLLQDVMSDLETQK
jgi:hypothetical protein